MEVQNLVESVSRELEGRVLLVATGQQELTADATLQKIQDRFTVKVVLKNQDVDAVVRRVLLNKEPAERPLLERTLADAAGPISRQLVGSKIQHSAQDDKDLLEDYPLLPSRRRFWRACCGRLMRGVLASFAPSYVSCTTRTARLPPQQSATLSALTSSTQRSTRTLMAPDCFSRRPSGSSTSRARRTRFEGGSSA